MKILVIGDLHGESIWKMFADLRQLSQTPNLATEYDKYIFLGDYFDSFKITSGKIRENFGDVIRLKNNYPDQVILLLGNHELHYFLVPYHLTNKFYCSGYRPEMHIDLYEFYKENKSLFQAAYQIKNYLFTHAGVSRGWVKNTLEKDPLELKDTNVAEYLQKLFDDRSDLIHTVGSSRGGSSYFGGPFWADKSETEYSILGGFHQIVGHTHVKEITKVGDDNSSITYCDVINSKNPEPLIIEV